MNKITSKKIPITYIAFLRGIGPGDPRMSNERLRFVFVSLGFSNVRSFISSGNIIFSSSTVPSEDKIEKEIVRQLGFFRPIVIRSQGCIQGLIERNPFGSIDHSSKNYTLVTFFKNPPTKIPFDIPFQSSDSFFKIIGYDENTQAIFSVTDHTAVQTPTVMTWLEKQFGKDITSRTWKTIERIYNTF